MLDFFIIIIIIIQISNCSCYHFMPLSTHLWYKSSDCIMLIPNWMWATGATATQTFLSSYTCTSLCNDTGPSKGFFQDFGIHISLNPDFRDCHRLCTSHELIPFSLLLFNLFFQQRSFSLLIFFHSTKLRSSIPNWVKREAGGHG